MDKPYLVIEVNFENVALMIGKTFQLLVLTLTLQDSFSFVIYCLGELKQGICVNLNFENDS